MSQRLLKNIQLVSVLSFHQKCNFLMPKLGTFVQNCPTLRIRVVIWTLPFGYRDGNSVYSCVMCSEVLPKLAGQVSRSESFVEPAAMQHASSEKMARNKFIRLKNMFSSSVTQSLSLVSLPPDDLCICIWISELSQHPDNRETGCSNVLPSVSLARGAITWRVGLLGGSPGGWSASKANVRCLWAMLETK